MEICQSGKYSSQICYGSNEAKPIAKQLVKENTIKNEATENTPTQQGCESSKYTTQCAQIETRESMQQMSETLHQMISGR